VDGRDWLGLGLGLAVVVAATLLDLAFADRPFPLTTTLLGPLVASALSRPRTVAAVGVVALGCAVLLASEEQLIGELTGWSRIALVATAGALSVLVAQLRNRHQQQLERAHRAADRSLTLQRRLLPNVSGTDHVAVRVTYRPSADDLVIGGDFIDVVPFPAAGPGAVGFCVGDVTGHDASAAGLAASMRAAWRVLALAGGSPSSWLSSLDRFVRSEAMDDELATVCVGVLDPARRRLLIASAGHPRPILLGDRAQLIDVDPGPPLGLPADLALPWSDEAVGLDTDFALVLYTDGLVEGRRAPGSVYRYGEESLTAWLDAAVPARAITDQQVRRLLSDVEAANGGPLVDDVALVVLAATSTAADPAEAADRGALAGPQPPRGAPPG
jgi:serine phosphatase RsbU (regulator of sigma subunit)